MAGSVNKVIILGRLGADPEVRTFQNGGKVCNLRVATSETWKDKQSGEKKERTEWHTVAIMSDPIVRIAEQYLRKGSQVYLEGQLQTRKWQDQSGADRYSTEVVLRPYAGTLTLLDKAPAQNTGYDADPQGAPNAIGGYGGAGGGSYDDDLPFLYEWRG